jgi:hypothetical protein
MPTARTSPPAARLAEARAVLRRCEPGPGHRGFAGGAGPLEVGAGVHEWIAGGAAWGGGQNSGDQSAGGPDPGRGGAWLPPLGVLIWVARALAGANASASRGRGCVLWVGRRVWPMPAALVRLPGRGGEDRSLLDRSVMVDADGPAERLWAIDTALRSAAAGVIVADGSGLDMASTRRLQLSAESSGSCAGAVCLLARPLRERRALSAAATRWLVEPDPIKNDDGPGWAVELLRRKGLRPEGHAHRWRVRSCHATGDVRVVPIAADRSGPPARQVGRRTG